MSSEGNPAVEMDPSWWEAAFTADDIGEGTWRPPEVTSRHLVQLLDDAPEGTLQREVLAALTLATSAMLDPENWSEPFKPMWVMDGRRSALPKDLTEAQFELLAQVLPHMKHAPVRARIADVLWCFHDRSNSELLRMAVDEYLAVPLERDAWIHRGDDAWRRAIQLVRRRGRAETDRLRQISEALRQRILAGSAADAFMLTDLSDMLRATAYVDADARLRLATHFTVIASEAAETGNLHLSRHLERRAQQWFASINDGPAANEAIERVARLYEREADERLANGDDGSALAAGIFLEKAIGTLRTLPRKYRARRGLEGYLTGLRSKLAENREETLEAMHRIQTDPIDLTDAVADTRKRLSGHSKFHALVYLAASWPLSDPEKDRAQAAELAQGSIRHLFSGATYAADGRKVAATPGGLEQPELAIWSDMVRSAGINRGVVATAFIRPGLDVITFEHRFDLAFLYRLCVDSPWVPPGHEELWARGLHHGLNGDFPSAVSLLVPQIEQALRRMLKGRGVYTLMVDDATGVESEKGLSALLSMTETLDVLGADLQYELITLLVEQQGDNLRHDTAHGLLHDSQAQSAGAVYAWWLCLRLVVVPLWNMRNTSDDPAPTDQLPEDPPGLDE